MRISVLYLCFVLFGFSLSAKEELFTAQEAAWIKNHPLITYGADPSWIPLDYIDEEGEHRGIAKDYLQEVSRISGLKFVLHPTKTWEETNQLIKKREIDLVPAVYYNKQRLSYLNFSTAYLKLAEYLFTQTQTPKVTSAQGMNGKKVALVKGYEVVTWLKQKHPEVKLVLKSNLLECLYALSSGEVDGVIGNLPSINYILEKYFITNIKANTIIADRDPQDLFMASRKDYPLLAQIIAKSLKKIAPDKQAEIFNKYAQKYQKNFGLRGAFGFGRPPYMYGKNSGKGIEETLVRQAFRTQGYKISEVRQMPIERGQTILLNNNELDFSAGVLEDKEDGLYYSDNFVKYENVAITRVSDKIKINSIKDLKGKKVVAWDKAYEMLGEEYKSYFSPEHHPKNYKEVYDQKEQHKLFFRKEADVIVVDKNIFKWYLNTYSSQYDAEKEYEMHTIFPKATWIKVAFRNQALRDIFNRGLREIKKSGRYDRIIAGFLKVDLQKQLDLVKILAAISAQYIFEADTQGLKKIVSKLDTLAVIRGIDFISENTKGSLLKLERKHKKYEEVSAFSWGESQAGVIMKPAYLYEEGNTIAVGKVKVYYEVKDFNDIAISYIPKLESFSDFTPQAYQKIASIYKQFGVNNTQTKLSIDEQKWIQEHPVIRFVGDPNWLPFEAFDEKGKYIGIVAEYLDEVENLTGLKFERIQTSTWEESVGLMKDKQADMISETTDSKMRSFLKFTDPYLQNHIIIIMNSKQKYVDSLSHIRKKKIVMIKEYGYVAKIKEAYPKISFMEAENINEALKMVSSGRADALLCTMALGSYHISKDGYFNLRIVGKTKFSTSIGYGIQPDLAPLVGIINKTIIRLDEGRKQEILKKWISQKYVEKIDYTLVWEVALGAFLLLMLFWYWNRQMKAEIGRRKEVEEALKEANEQVKKSIEFSSMIQHALIPMSSKFTAFFSDAFTLWKPRDIVGGDIYFFETLRHEQEALLFVVDCTGHGVPGAFVTMLVKAIERNIIGHIKKTPEEVVSPAKLLALLNRSMKHLLQQEDKNAASNVGFDAGILYLNKREKIARYAGAEIALYYSVDKKVKRIKGDRQSVGYRTSDLNYEYKEHELPLEESMRFYLSTDGYIDQNGGEKGFPFSRKRFQKVLEDSQDKTMAQTQKLLIETLKAYQGDYEANDDITVIGVAL